jgi:hypothetical protein
MNNRNKRRILPAWYRIPEIEPSKFVGCLSPLYTVLENNHKSKSEPDPFLQSISMGYTNMTKKDWDETEKKRLYQNALEMKMGDFHEELMGKFPGYETYPNGHHTRCDVGSLDGKVLLEVKNRHNTVKGSDGKHIVKMLKEYEEKGITAILVQVNCPNGKVNRYGADPSVKIWNGREAYEFLSGRKTFFDDLLETVTYVFANFKTQAQLKESLGIA